MKGNRLAKLFVLGLFLGVTNLTFSESSERKVIYPQNFKSSSSAASPAIQVGDTIYVSGQGGKTGTGEKAEPFEAQVRHCLQGIRNILQAGRMDFENIVWINVYLVNFKNFDAMNSVYWEMIGNSPPARTVLGVASLPAGNEVMINCIAVADAKVKKAILPAGFPKRSNSDPPAILAKDVLYLSAQGSRDRLTGKHPESFADQVKKALDNVGDVLKSAGMTHKNVVWVNPYMDNFKQYGEMNSVYETYFEFGNTPGRGSIEVVQMPDSNHVAFSCIAGGDLSKRKAFRPRNMPLSSTASPGVMYRDTLYLSAKSGFIPSQGIVTADVELQLRQTMRNLLDGLEEADMDFSNVVSTTVYLKDMKDYDKMNDLYGSFFTNDKSKAKVVDYNERMGHKTLFNNDPPAQTMLQQSFDKGTKTEEQISLIAVKPAKR